MHYSTNIISIYIYIYIYMFYLYVSIYIYTMCMYICIYIYIYAQREGVRVRKPTRHFGIWTIDLGRMAQSALGELLHKHEAKSKSVGLFT